MCPGDLLESSAHSLPLTISGVILIVYKTSTSGMESTVVNIFKIFIGEVSKELI